MNWFCEGNGVGKAAFLDFLWFFLDVYFHYYKYTKLTGERNVGN